MLLHFKQTIMTDMHVHISIYKASELLKARGCGAVKQAKLKTAISELGQNILKYAETGTITIYEISEPEKGIKVIVEDEGPGIPNLEQALSDNFSTSGTLGLGLPGVKRMVDTFGITSEIDKGTKVEICLFF